MQLPKIGWVRYRNSREVLGEIRSVTVSLSVGKCFVSISTLREVEQPWHPSRSSVGLDWGVARFYTLSDGEYQDQLQPLKELLPKLAKLQGRLARKKKFSSNWKKAKAKITKLHTKIANIRKDFVHQSSNDISKNHAVVFVEDLQVKNMSASAKGRKAKPGKKVRQKSGLNRSILDASPFELRRQLEYKKQWNGGLLVPVSPQNTSRKCPECQHTSAENVRLKQKRESLLGGRPVGWRNFYGSGSKTTIGWYVRGTTASAMAMSLSCWPKTRSRGAFGSPPSNCIVAPGARSVRPG
jgi:putative transposase